METQLSVLGNKDTQNIQILFWGEIEQCVAPDSEMLSQPHVIIPLADLTPDFIHPIEKKKLSTIAEELCGKNFMSHFPIVDLYEDIKNEVTKSSDVITVANGSVENERFQNRGIPSKSERHVALITGAAKRIGACITTKLHNIDYNVTSITTLLRLKRYRWLKNLTGIVKDIVLPSTPTTNETKNVCMLW